MLKMKELALLKVHEAYLEAQLFVLENHVKPKHLFMFLSKKKQKQVIKPKF